MVGHAQGGLPLERHLMTYVSAARGYKAGGFNLDRVQSSDGLSSAAQGIIPVNDTSFPGEFVDSYELGAKTTWAGGNLLLNATLFHQTYERLPAQQLPGHQLRGALDPRGGVAGHGRRDAVADRVQRPDAAGRRDLCRYPVRRRRVRA